MEIVKHETCLQYVARRLSEGWRIIKRGGCNVILRSPKGIIRPVDLRNDVLTLRPSAAGDETNITTQFPDSGAHWEKVDEVVADDNSTYVQVEWIGEEGRRDLYNLPASSGSGTINFIKVYYRFGHWRDGRTAYCTPAIKTGGTAYEGDENSVVGIVWKNGSHQWTDNPQTEAAWTWADIDALQIGIKLTFRSAYQDGRCTQVYVEVDYTPGWSGKISGVTNPAKVMEVPVANIAKVKGVASA